MDLGLGGKVALVAAASKGLGRAVAEELFAEGCDVAICARDGDLVAETARQISHGGDREVLPFMADVSLRRDVTSFYEATIARFGKIDIVVTNAGGPPSGKFEEIELGEWERAFRLTLMSTVEMVSLALGGMKERNWGRILNITSIAAKQPVDNLILSNSLRSAVTGFARTLANEVAPFGITVNNLLPGYTLTDRVDQLSRAVAVKEGLEIAQVRARWEAQIPMNRLGEPREFAALAAFMASDRASYITGQSIAVDGGWIRSLL